MPSKRTRKPRQRRDPHMPAWAKRYLSTGETPPLDTEDCDAYIGWRYFDDHVPGLPDEKEIRRNGR